METKAIVIASITFLVVVCGLFGFTWYQKSLVTEQVSEPVTVTPDQSEDSDSEMRRITAKHYYIDGVHTLVGEIEMPTPCDLLQHEVVVAESFPEQIMIDFTVLNNSENCIQVITSQRFMVEVPASEAVTISARYEGVPVILNLIPAAEGETPDEFELFIKG